MKLWNRTRKSDANSQNGGIWKIYESDSPARNFGQKFHVQSQVGQDWQIACQMRDLQAMDKAKKSSNLWAEQ